MPQIPTNSMQEVTDRKIVGAHTWPYQFLTKDGKRKIASGFFESDNEAVNWFLVNYPKDYETGAEMRRFD